MKLEAENLTFSYGAKKILDNIGFSVAEGEFVSLLGPSGSGKSTVLKLLTGVLKGEKGKIRIDGREIRDPSGRFAYMPQNDLLFPWKTILDNVCLYGQIHGSLEAMRKEARGYLSEFGLAGYEDCYPSQLSGGMRQRAALIRTLALKPDILLLDEPFSALDYQTRLEVCDDISTIIRTRKKTAILITHDLSEAISVADRILVLSSRPGRVKSVLPVPFAQEYDRPLLRRNAPEFSSYFNQLWKELKTHD